MILNTRRNTSSSLAKARLGFISAAAALAAILAIYIGPRLVVAQSDAPPPKRDAFQPPQVGAPVALPPPREELAPGPVLVEPSSAPRPGKGESAPALNPPQNLGEDSMPPPAPPRPRKAPKPPILPRLGLPPVEPARDASLEDRLDRLERLVKSLVAQQNPKRERIEAWTREADSQDAFASQKDLARLKSKVKRDASVITGQAKEDLQIQLKALQRQREALQREMEKLQRQIEQIERDHERMDDGLDEKREGRNEFRNESDRENSKQAEPKPPKIAF